MPSFPEMAWMEGYRDRVNADPEMAVIGGWFTTALSFTFDELLLPELAYMAGSV